jgi:hypothetical protein
MATAERLEQIQVYGHLALKAQNQCRATLATLADIKNPQAVAFIKNTATNQQVNIGEPNYHVNELSGKKKSGVSHLSYVFFTISGGG